DPKSRLAEGLADLLEERRELAEEDRMHVRRQLPHVPRDRRLDRAVRGAGRDGTGPGTGRRVAEEPGRDDPVGRDREPSDGAAYGAGDVDGAHQRAAHFGVPEGPA